MRVVARICLALFALFFVVAIGLYVVLPRACGGDVVGAHLPEAAQGNLAPMDELKARRLRALLLRRLNR